MKGGTKTAMLLRFVFEPLGRPAMEWTACPRGEKRGGGRLASIPSLQIRVLPLGLLYDDGGGACGTFFDALFSLRGHIAGEGASSFAFLLDRLGAPCVRTTLSVVLPAPSGGGEALYEHTASFADDGHVSERLALSTRSTCRELYRRDGKAMRESGEMHAVRQFREYVKDRFVVTAGRERRGRKLVRLHRSLSCGCGATAVDGFDDGLTSPAAARLLNDFLGRCCPTARGQLIAGVSSPDLMSMVEGLRRDELFFFMNGTVTNGTEMPDLPRYGRTMKHVRERYMDACASFADAVLEEENS